RLTNKAFRLRTKLSQFLFRQIGKGHFSITLAFQLIVIIPCLMFQYLFTKTIKGVPLTLLMAVRFHILTPSRAVTPLFPFRHYYGGNCKTAKLISEFRKKL